ncbi:MAG: inorganic phosphate transporter [Candidatus Cloacimonetes bacterium]|nr:inorganic phosphate transporter [Candidatus Cloacimonadota bacterium]
MFTILMYLSSGLFLGWSLGANNAANFWGTAVGTRMVKFRTAAILCSILVIVGAVVSGAGASMTIGKLGAINSLGGAFTVALATAVISSIMTRAGIPISTSQAVIGGIIGWNIFTGSPTDYTILGKIAMTWITSPLLTAIIAFLMFYLVKVVLDNSKWHMLKIDAWTRFLLIVVGAFGSYSLGANNIGNVMGIFVSASPFSDINVMGIFDLSSIQQLFLLGGIAIAVGVITYSKRVMSTVSINIYKLSPVTALIVVFAVSITMFLFASVSFKTFLTSHGLPSFPLVPVSSSQAIVGAVIGVSLAKGGKNLQVRMLMKVALGWVVTPVATAILALVLLYITQNVFLMEVFSKG